jgi:hypothetical protein
MFNPDFKICSNCNNKKEINNFSDYKCTVKGKEYNYKRNYCTECIKEVKRISSKKTYKKKSVNVDVIENEIWKDIIGYEGFYKVSNLGRIQRNNKSIIKPEKTNRGYLRVILSKNSNIKKKSVHRLVAMGFIPNPENKPQVNHIDSDKENNNKNNLEWCTGSENMKHWANTKNIS